MANNTLRTPQEITRKALQILHQKLTFVGAITRTYDDRFAQQGAKIGDTLQIRLPNQYNVTTGATLVKQDTVEDKVDLVVGTQKHVGMEFSSKELTLSLDDFADRILEPAMSALAADLEADAYSMYKDVPNVIDNDAAAISFRNIMSGRRILNERLAPIDNNRTAILSPFHTVGLVDALKGLFQDSEAIKKQYREGMMGRTSGFDFYESTHATDHLTGTAVKATTYTVTGAGQVGSAITIGPGTTTTTFLKGDIVTFAGCNAVHPETKADLGYLKQFVVTANYAGGAGNLAISPAIVATGAKRNVTASPTNTGAVTKVGAGASELLNSSLVFHKSAFALATADLVMPKGVDFAARETFDGISMRLVRQYDINSDQLVCRADILYGYKAIRPELACRIHADA